MKHSLALAKALGTLTLIALFVGSLSWPVLADKKDIPRLIEMATNDLLPEFRLAASRTLVAAYLFIGRTLKDLEPLAHKAEKERGFPELRQAIKEAEQGKVINACFILPEIKSTTVDGVNLAGRTKQELEFQAQFGATDSIKRTAAQILLKQLVEPVKARQPNWYAYRVREEEHFDAVKVQLYLWTVAVISVPMKEVNLPALSQVFFAEFLVTLAPGVVEPKLQCPR